MIAGVLKWAGRGDHDNLAVELLNLGVAIVWPDYADSSIQAATKMGSASSSLPAFSCLRFHLNDAFGAGAADKVTLNETGRLLEVETCFGAWVAITTCRDTRLIGLTPDPVPNLRLFMSPDGVCRLSPEECFGLTQYGYDSAVLRPMFGRMGLEELAVRFGVVDTVLALSPVVLCR